MKGGKPEESRKLSTSDNPETMRYSTFLALLSALLVGVTVSAAPVVSILLLHASMYLLILGAGGD
jgi:hypothetical protein